MAGYLDCMVFAGLIDEGMIDEDYQEQVVTLGEIDYRRWVSLTEKWDSLNKQYMAEVDPYYQSTFEGDVPEKTCKKGKELLGQMAVIESELGY